jgi:hypothetical protein
VNRTGVQLAKTVPEISKDCRAAYRAFDEVHRHVQEIVIRLLEEDIPKIRKLWG